MGSTPPGWPFFAPSAPEGVAVAFDLAGVGAGDHVVDLGCGDGQALVAALGRGARVTGVECDPELADVARGVLGAAAVVEADLFDGGLWARFDPPDVVFCYLSPATLQRLTPQLRSLPAGTRLVTVDFPVPGLVPDAEEAAAHLYCLPGRRRRPRPSRVGWPAAGTLCVMPPKVTSLTCVDVVHAGGPFTLSLTGALPHHASAAAGLDSGARGTTVAVDVRWQPCAAGTVAHGYVAVDGVDPHLVVVLFAHDDQDQWDLTAAGCAALLSRLRNRALPPPRTASDLLSALT
ncbi:MAG TPA: methyltransferase domain-containing protein [Acidimicrobiales bacterium]|nr:methyltransferase domain-containing protein [Acidimicrobiales bacterium]